MEIRKLRLEGTPGKQENFYVMSVPLPGKLDVLNIIEKPPFHIYSKDDTTYSTGILAHVPHSFKLRISRDYQEPYVGLYAKITPKPDEIIEIGEVSGSFTILPSPSSKSHNRNQHLSYESNNNLLPPSSSRSESSDKLEPIIVPFSFFKSSVSKLPELESFDYYESRCSWPEIECRVDLSIKVVKTLYSVFVDDANCSCDSNRVPKDTVTSSPYFLSNVYSDVTIQVGEELFPAHKIILSERSRYFSRMFANSMRESTEGFVKISDEDESLFRELLRFIYQGSVENLEDNASDLFVLSDKYDMPELTCLCENFLLSQLTIENAMELYDLSQSVATQKSLLAKKSKELIMWNREKFASDLQTFKNFAKKYPELIFELLQI